MLILRLTEWEILLTMKGYKINTDDQKLKCDLSKLYILWVNESIFGVIFGFCAHFEANS